ncbi:Nif3-like dinuclear metal center hexameric protein [Catellatospora sp. KI3]|uniref:Nif3-like dinuclear metal center hexameric protein n=1 Tax=Catellatospora sp. KI3 TaxID=3041620 RepID=UPI002482A57E|nr:Nif3-like dinuclear metal center hexameric protein [Catellatospora sp. KI3]MDI1459564.1 Nif3-like dinuclear metal center hexameric protein [Catellatospora sp. KI3]
MSWTVASFVRLLDEEFPPGWAEPWDRVGLVAGRPEHPVTRVLTVVDVLPETVAQALDLGADMIIAHHPLLLSGVSSVAAVDYQGRILHDLIENRVGLFVAHTNADVANPGVSDALATRLGLTDLRPLRPTEDGRGAGRIGRINPMTLGEFAHLAATALPVASWGVRVSGDPARIVRTVAVCGGSGDSFIPDAVAAGVDVYLTADLKHHRVSEHLAEGGPALVDAGHYATEAPWLTPLAAWLRSRTGLEIIVSDANTDPFRFHACATLDPAT